MKTIQLNKPTVTIIQTILQAQLDNLNNPEVIKSMSLIQRPQLAIAKKQIKKILKEIGEVLQ